MLYTIEVHHFFLRFLSSGAYDLPLSPQKTIIRITKTAFKPDENSHGVGVQRESPQKRPVSCYCIYDDFGLKGEARHSETVFAKKRYTSIVTRVGYVTARDVPPFSLHTGFELLARAKLYLPD